MAFFAYNPNNNNNNRRSHPFWDFVNSMEGLNRRPPSYAPRDGHDGQQAGQAQAPGQEQAQEKATYKSPAVEDEKMAEAPISKKERREERRAERKERRAERKERKRESREESESSSSSSSDEGQCGRRRCRGGGRRGMHHHGPPPFGPWGLPGSFIAGDFSDWAGPHQRHGRHHGPGRRHWGPPPPPGLGHHPPPAGPAFGPHGPHGPHGPQDRRQCRGGPFGRRGPGREFNIPAFLAQLGNRLGIDLNAAAANFGVDLSRAAGTANPDVDFVPFHDLFDLENEYLVHVSLPGAHREDIGLDFDGEHHTLRVGGVVYRPGVDETISAAISHSGRDREIGVFETKVRLPSKNNDLIEVNPANISAKLRDGVLVVRVPKIQKKKEDLKRSIRIDTPSPDRQSATHDTTNLAVREKDINRDNPFANNNKGKDKAQHNDMYYFSPAFGDSPGTEAGDEQAAAGRHDEATAREAGEAAREAARKEAEYDHVMKDHEDPPEQLPAYTPSHPDEDDEEEQEGEYVKINVD